MLKFPSLTLHVNARLFSNDLPTQAHPPFLHQRKLAKPADKGISCASLPSAGCFQCIDSTDLTDGNREVTIDYSGCKGDSISWVCVIGADCNSDGVLDSTCYDRASQVENSCTGTPENEKCQSAMAVKYTVPHLAKELLINGHDGQFSNGAGNFCQGGQPGSVGNQEDIDNYCLVNIPIAVSSCGIEPKVVSDKEVKSRSISLPASNAPHTLLLSCFYVFSLVSATMNL